MRPSAKHVAAPNGAVLDVKSHGRVRANLIRVAAVLVGLAVAGLLVIDGSSAAFSDQTHNDKNSVATGTVELTDDDANTAMFDVSGLNGGQSVERCINVTYSGSLKSDVKLYGAVAGSGLAPGLTTKIEVGTGAKTGPNFGCAGFTGGSSLFNGTLAAFGSSHGGYANGLGGFTNASDPTTKSYKITMTVSNDNAYQGKSATVDFTWEAQGKDA